MHYAELVTWSERKKPARSELMSYHDTVHNVYRDAALSPDSNLCCVNSARKYLPELVIPDEMIEMNYGCGATVRPEDMREGQRVLYVGVGGGMEALELAYYTRRPGGVIAVEPVPEMRQAAAKNFEIAAKLNPWFDPSFVEVVDGDALELPCEDNTFDFAAQNCLFNIFKTGGDLEKALAEIYRVLIQGGRLSMSDPITSVTIPEQLVNDERLRAACISGCLSLDDYLKQITDVGFGMVEVRQRRPYRVIDSANYETENDILLESIDVVAIKNPMPEDGPCIFTGKTATYSGKEEFFDDGKGHVLMRGMPQSVCDKTAKALVDLDRSDLLFTDSTWHYAGDGCC